MVFGRRWLEESCAQLNGGEFIWPDCEHEKLTNRPFIEENTEDDRLQFELGENRKESPADNTAQRLRKSGLVKIEIYVIIIICYTPIGPGAIRSIYVFSFYKCCIP
jgi:hypothetical protein